MPSETGLTVYFGPPKTFAPARSARLKAYSATAWQIRRSILSVRSATSSSPSPSRHSCAPYASPTAMRTIEIGAWTPPSGTTPGMRRPVRTITFPPISSRRMRFGEPTSSRPTAPLQATGIDKAGRRQYLYHPEYRAQQEQAKYDKLIRFAERLPDLRQAMGEHMTLDPLAQDRVSAIAVRLINLTWFRVGSERYVRESNTYGVTTLTKRHVSVRGKRVSFRFQTKHGFK